MSCGCSGKNGSSSSSDNRARPSAARVQTSALDLAQEVNGGSVDELAAAADANDGAPAQAYTRRDAPMQGPTTVLGTWVDDLPSALQRLAKAWEGSGP